MIVANALTEAFKNFEITYNEYKSDLSVGNEVTKKVFFDYGDQKELNRWVSNRKGLQSFPLIWYTLPPYKNPRNNVFVEVNAKIILFTSTKSEFWNKERALINYNQILNPLYEKIKKRLQEVNYIEIISTEIDVNDEPNFGVDTDKQTLDNDFSTKSTKGSKSITLEYLDAKIIGIKIRVYPINCIN